MPGNRKNGPKGNVAYFNRELSWLAFNRRVLDLAVSDRQPLLERLKFMSIVSSNLDEFFEIRVAGLMQQVDSGVIEEGLDGLGPKEQLRRIHSIVSSMVTDQYRTWREQLVPALKEERIIFKKREDLTRNELRWIREYFHEQVFPVLTPMATDPSHPFPQLGNKTLNIMVWLDDPGTPATETLLAIIPVPRILPRVVRIEAKTRQGYQAYIFLSDLIKMFTHELFPGYRIRGAWAFRITRNSDLYIDEEEAENLLKKIEEELRKMRRGDPVRLEIEDDVSEEMLVRLLKAIGLQRQYVFPINGPINLLRLMSVYGLIDRPDLKYKAFQPYLPAKLVRREQIFDNIHKEDILLHHPYDSFSPVVDFLKEAGADPKVFAIKQTLYRTSGDSPIIEALKAASLNGKQVTALVELKARFDEANNIQWARELEQTGVHVVYGLVGLKTHCKCCLVVRREEGGKMRRYAHLGTGNYNPRTARIYTDMSLFTADEALTEEVAALFNSLTGFSRSPDFRHLLVAPFNLHSGMQEKIRREIRNAKAGRKARIIAKVNSLIDKETINHLYQASQAGVQVDLIVRGICGLVPHVPGLSDNVRVRSIVGRFLEHSRIFYFENAQKEPELWMGSADWMPRNFFRRIECVFPVRDPALRKELTEEILYPLLKDNEFATMLRSNGAYAPVGRAKAEEAFSAQEYFMTKAIARKQEQEKMKAEETSQIIPNAGPVLLPSTSTIS